MTVETVDAVVVGAGPNGLVAANLLADAGWDVVVVEATDEPGGAVRSAERTAPGFVSDLCSAFFPLAAGSPVLRDLELEAYGLSWRHAPTALAHVLPDDQCVVLSRDLDVTAESVASFAPQDGGAWRELVGQWGWIRDELLDVILRPFPPVRPAARLLRRLGTAEAVRLARMSAMPVRRMAEELFAGEGARLLTMGSALHTDLGPDSAGSAGFGWLLTMLGQDVGFPAPAGGAGGLTDALVRRLTTRGGRVHCRRPVTDVLVARGQAMGVRDADGELVRARRAVLADVPAPILYENLVAADQLPARLLADLERFQWDHATIKVDWALSKPIPWTSPETREAGTVHLGGDIDGLVKFGAQLLQRRVPDPPFVLLGQMTTADPSRSPEGTEAVWAYTHVPRGQQWRSDRLRRHADRIERLIEQHAPGFGDAILARHVDGPADLQEHNPGLVEGAINAGTCSLHQQLVFRPVPGLGRADTPIDRLFLANASAHPGGAVHGAAGANAARAALARTGLGGGVYSAAIRTANRLLYE